MVAEKEEEEKKSKAVLAALSEAKEDEKVQTAKALTPQGIIFLQANSSEDLFALQNIRDLNPNMQIKLEEKMKNTKKNKTLGQNIKWREGQTQSVF